MCVWGWAALGEGKGEVLPQGMCTHTHNKIRLLRKTRFWVGVRSTACFAGTTRQGSGLESLRTDPSTNEKMTHVDTYYKYFVTMYFWVGSLWDLGLRTTQRAVLINKFQLFDTFAFLQFLITQDVWSPTMVMFICQKSHQHRGRWYSNAITRRILRSG